MKSLNFAWHVALATADAIVLALFIAPELITSATTTQLGLYRALGAAVLPIAVLLLMNVMSSNFKAMLVYWKPYGWLPGCEAFTKFGPADHRVDMAHLKKNVGTWAEEPKEQNSKWYKLYKQVETTPEVAYAQKDFLMYRDMAVLSLPLIVLAPLGLYIADASTKALWIGAAMFVVQYVLTAISARNAGERFVCNVLAVHSAKQFTTPKATAPAKATSSGGSAAA
ncbi:hypothetical protein HK414_04095 [Ramlibacter terrae]|uniref:Uncharacterized protein n=1 Tax=Ramlibacter terrae TaxID=2732511 RepID=A0ABX6P1L1_9BURK|nr:hypothetical protein HK414_04095 [Ramlibacter terrae]